MSDLDHNRLPASQPHHRSLASLSDAALSEGALMMGKASSVDSSSSSSDLQKPDVIDSGEESPTASQSSGTILSEASRSPRPPRAPRVDFIDTSHPHKKGVRSLSNPSSLVSSRLAYVHPRFTALDTPAPMASSSLATSIDLTSIDPADTVLYTIGEESIPTQPPIELDSDEEEDVMPTRRAPHVQQAMLSQSASELVARSSKPAPQRPQSMDMEAWLRERSVGIQAASARWSLHDRGTAGESALVTERTSPDQLRRLSEIRKGIALFNEKPMKGIEHLLATGCVKEDEIAEFLLETEGLKKPMIGEFLGNKAALSQRVLSEYTSSLDLSGMPFDDALRYFLSRFTLKGEAQMIDRIMEAFSGRFHACNPGWGMSADSLHLLAYSCIMLNTDAHHPGVKQRMSKRVFVKNVLKVTNEVSASALEQIYESITAREIAVDGDTGTDSKAQAMFNIGSVFIKFGRAGKPHPRRVFVDKSWTRVQWSPPGSDKDTKSILISDIVNVVRGPLTPVFRRYTQEEPPARPPRPVTRGSITRSRIAPSPDSPHAFGNLSRTITPIVLDSDHEMENTRTSHVLASSSLRRLSEEEEWMEDADTSVLQSDTSLRTKISSAMIRRRSFMSRSSSASHRRLSAPPRPPHILAGIQEDSVLSHKRSPSPPLAVAIKPSAHTGSSPRSDIPSPLHPAVMSRMKSMGSLPSESSPAVSGATPAFNNPAHKSHTQAPVSTNDFRRSLTRGVSTDRVSRRRMPPMGSVRSQAASSFADVGGTSKTKIELVPARCFSLVSSRRTLDLMAPNAHLCDEWIDQFTQVIARNQMSNSLKILAARKIQKEQRIHNTVEVWQKDVLPNFESAIQQKKVRQLWRLGIPPGVRPQIWSKAIGNPLAVTSEAYVRLKQKAVTARGQAVRAEIYSNHGVETALQDYQADLPLTFPELKVFHEGGPLAESLLNVVEAYVFSQAHRLSQLKGTAFLAAMLLLHTDEADAFSLLTNLLHSNPFGEFLKLIPAQVEWRLELFDQMLKDILPMVHNHLEVLGVAPGNFVTDWFLTLFAKHLSVDLATRVWDNFLLDGEMFLYRTALGILSLLSCKLQSEDADGCLKLLVEIYMDVDETVLFSAIEEVKESKAHTRALQANSQHCLEQRVRPAEFPGEEIL